MAPPWDPKDRKHLQSTQSTVNRHTSQTKHQALPKGPPERRITPINTAAVHASAQQQPANITLTQQGHHQILSANAVTGRVRAHSCVRETCVRRLHAAWGVTVCRSGLPFARGCGVGVWFGFVGAALLPAVGTCVVLAFGAMPGRCCFLRVTPDDMAYAWTKHLEPSH